VSVDVSTSLADAAKRMRDEGVGDLVKQKPQPPTILEHANPWQEHATPAWPRFIA
jgi:hypothetical protein